MAGQLCTPKSVGSLYAGPPKLSKIANNNNTRWDVVNRRSMKPTVLWTVDYWTEYVYVMCVCLISGWGCDQLTMTSRTWRHGWCPREVDWRRRTPLDAGSLVSLTMTSAFWPSSMPLTVTLDSLSAITLRQLVVQLSTFSISLLLIVSHPLKVCNSLNIYSR